MMDQCARCQVEVGVHDQPQSQSECLWSLEKARHWSLLSSLAGLTPTLSFRNLGLAGARRSQQTDSLHAIPVAVNQELRSPWPWPPESHQPSDMIMID